MNAVSDTEIKIVALEILVRELLNVLDENTFLHILINIENGFKITESDNSISNKDKAGLRDALHRILTPLPRTTPH
ncbi:hypothetical protein EXO80_13075 [Salmonella enterica]|nr:hypothetical protein [Salmonella enterica]ECH1725496.1 hypothetical protein [Salmonella enterica]